MVSIDMKLPSLEKVDKVLELPVEGAVRLLCLVQLPGKECKPPAPIKNCSRTPCTDSQVGHIGGQYHRFIPQAAALMGSLHSMHVTCKG